MDVNVVALGRAIYEQHFYKSDDFYTSDGDGTANWDALSPDTRAAYVESARDLMRRYSDIVAAEPVS